MIPHPLALGFIRRDTPVAYTVVGTQSITLTKLFLKNESSSDQNIFVGIYARGRMQNIVGGEATEVLEAGYSREIPVSDVKLDQGCMIMVRCDNDNKVSYIIDGVESFDARTR